MSRLDRRACALVALIALASFAGTASVDAQSQGSQERQAHRLSMAQRQAAWRKAAARPGRGTFPARAQAGHPRARWRAAYARERPPLNYQREMVARGLMERRLADGSVMHDTLLADGARLRVVSRGAAANRVRIVRYGNTLSGTVERTIRPGLTSRTFVGGGRVLYTRVYQRHVWHRFGRALAYDTFVPAVRYPAVYYAWALARWPHPVSYGWSWSAQPWYPTYGVLFTPYPVYTSPDLWMTDYIIAQSMQAAYQAQTAAPAAAQTAAQPLPWGPAAAASQSSDAPTAAQASDTAPAVQSSGTPSTAQSSGAPPAPVPLPPAITPQVKADLDAEIKVQLQEQRAAAATPAVFTAQSTPPALRPNHVFFQVVEPLDVPSGHPNRSCSLSADDYIKRTGGMSNDDWKIPVTVELSGPSDCPEGLHTRIGLNDLSAMENEQEAQVMEAMRAASKGKGIGSNGPPSGPGTQPTFIAEGSAAPDPGALQAIRQVQ